MQDLKSWYFSYYHLSYYHGNMKHAFVLPSWNCIFLCPFYVSFPWQKFIPTQMEKKKKSNTQNQIRSLLIFKVFKWKQSLVSIEVYSILSDDASYNTFLILRKAPRFRLIRRFLTTLGKPLFILKDLTYEKFRYLT